MRFQITALVKVIGLPPTDNAQRVTVYLTTTRETSFNFRRSRKQKLLEIYVMSKRRTVVRKYCLVS